MKERGEKIADKVMRKMSSTKKKTEVYTWGEK